MINPYYQDSAVTIYHGDCGQIMPCLAQSFDLLLTDPPYGIGENSRRANSRGRMHGQSAPLVADYGEFDWDQKAPEWIIGLAIMKCRESIIFGGNYYFLPPASCWLVWDKENSGDFADGEMAWTNLKKAMRIKRHLWNGMIRKGHEARFHPTQKPLEVISWAIQQSSDAQTILDPFAGSGTTGRAAKDLGKKATLIEIEERYCEIAAKRMAQEVFDFKDNEASQGDSSFDQIQLIN